MRGAKSKIDNDDRGRAITCGANDAPMLSETERFRKLSIALIMELDARKTRLTYYFIDSLSK